MKKVGDLLFIFTVFLFIGTFSISLIMLNFYYPLEYKNLIIKHAEFYGLSPAMVASIINVESGFRPDAVSPQGAIGLMQIMPGTALDIKNRLRDVTFEVSDLFDPETNINYGCYYLKYLNEIYENNTTNVLASYNAGLTNVNIWLQNISYSSDGETINRTPFNETNNFIKRVNRNYRIYNRHF